MWHASHIFSLPSSLFCQTDYNILRFTKKLRFRELNSQTGNQVRIHILLSLTVSFFPYHSASSQIASFPWEENIFFKAFSGLSYFNQLCCLTDCTNPCQRGNVGKKKVEETPDNQGIIGKKIPQFHWRTYGRKQQ